MSSRIFLFLADLSLISIIHWGNKKLLPFKTLVSSRQRFLNRLIRNLFVFLQFISIYWFNQSRILEVYLWYYLCFIIIPDVYKILSAKRMIAELLLIGPHNVITPRFGKITSCVNVETISNLSTQISARNPDGLIVNTLDKSILRYALLNSNNKPVIKLMPTPDTIKLTDLFEVYKTVAMGKAHLCADQKLSALVIKKLPKGYFVPARKADYVLDLTCMNTQLSKVFDRSKAVKIAVKYKLPLFVFTPIQSAHNVDSIICRAYEAAMLEYTRTIILRIPLLVELGLEFPKVKKDILCVHVSRLVFYINSVWEKHQRVPNFSERIVEFLEGEHLLSEDLRLLLERI